MFFECRQRSNPRIQVMHCIRAKISTTWPWNPAHLLIGSGDIYEIFQLGKPCVSSFSVLSTHGFPQYAQGIRFRYTESMH